MGNNVSELVQKFSHLADMGDIFAGHNYLLFVSYIINKRFS